MSARTRPRFTQDADLAVEVAGDREAEHLVFELQSRGFQVFETVEQQETGRLATVRCELTDEAAAGVGVDLLFASSGIEPEIVEAAEVIDVVPGLRVPVARIGHLLALKILARDDERRPQDLMDLRALLAEAGDDELDLARASLQLITERGFHRNKDLLAELRRLTSG